MDERWFADRSVKQAERYAQWLDGALDGGGCGGGGGGGSSAEPGHYRVRRRDRAPDDPRSLRHDGHDVFLRDAHPHQPAQPDVPAGHISLAMPALDALRTIDRIIAS